MLCRSYFPFITILYQKIYIYGFTHLLLQKFTYYILTINPYFVVHGLEGEDIKNCVFTSRNVSKKLFNLAKMLL
jgi:hypothetical protein